VKVVGKMTGRLRNQCSHGKHNNLGSSPGILNNENMLDRFIRIFYNVKVFVAI